MIIDGLEISAAIRAECAAAAAHLAAVGTPPGLAVILVGVTVTIVLPLRRA